ETLHGTEVTDNYRWLEDGTDAEVLSWQTERNKAAAEALDGLAQNSWLEARFQHLWRYDDESTPDPCLLSERILYWTKKADQDKWVLHLRENTEDAEGRVILDPNTWEETETASRISASPDCQYLAYGIAKGGDENPILRILDLDSMEELPDRMSGWKQGGAQWLHDNSGFYYTAKPLEGEVPEGEHFYWHRTYFHELGTDGSQDPAVHQDDKVKELYHWVEVSEDGQRVTAYKSQFNKNEVRLLNLNEEGGQFVPMVTGMEDEYYVDVVEDRLFITTDWNAPRYRVLTTTTDKPGREHWQEFIGEHEEDTMSYIAPVGGHLYVSYRHNAHTRIAVHKLDGTYLHDVALPTIGTARVWGYWSKPDVWLSFSSFAHPSTTYKYNVKDNSLALYKESPIDIDPSNMTSEQVWFTSKDGTKIPMFIVHNKDLVRDGTTPLLLTGYGGFNNSEVPRFSTLNAVWLEAGGAVAIPNLRGGGEFGKTWHEAGMREKKQNVFDDFIAAAEWLFANDYTNPDKIAISGGSNGGLLVSAVMVQRPELYRAVLCQVPLTDMIRFHKFGLANIWSEEYGNADEAEMFPHLLAYSPYHNVNRGADYPALFVTGSSNDARTDPAHARKFYAAIEGATGRDTSSEKALMLSVFGESGHGGAVTIDTQAAQYAQKYAFLMWQLEMPVPGTPAPKER
ncbi:MAG: S9 family peptidase, partial [Proteobacteria bacterium]|nr:S9 family peptidase [Pseudomonadota bacterium]